MSPGRDWGAVVCYWNPKCRDSGTGSLPLEGRGTRHMPVKVTGLVGSGLEGSEREAFQVPQGRGHKAERHSGPCAAVKPGQDGPAGELGLTQWS